MASDGYAWLSWGCAAVPVIAGLIAARQSTRSARGPLERKFVRRMCVGIWGLMTAFVAALLWLPSPWRWIVGGALVLIVPWLTYRWTTQRQLIRELESRGERSSTVPTNSPGH